MKLFYIKSNTKSTESPDILNSGKHEDLEHLKQYDPHFAHMLDLTFKKFLEADSNDFLSNFETSVVFVMKRKEFLKSQNFEKLYSKLEEQQNLLKLVNDEVKNLKTINKKAQSQIESLNDKITNMNYASTKLTDNKSKKKTKGFCAIS